MKYWLVKTEVEDYSIDDLKRDRQAEWTGVRNYQARNFLKEMEPGERLLFYHSNGDPSGVAGTAVVKRKAKPDLTQFDSRSIYYDEKATKEQPRWFAPLVGFESKFAELMPLDLLRGRAKLKDMVLLKRGNRLSVMPVSKSEFEEIIKLSA